VEAGKNQNRDPEGKKRRESTLDWGNHRCFRHFLLVKKDATGAAGAGANAANGGLREKEEK